MWIVSEKQDPVIQAVVRQMRDAVVDTDVAIVGALNKRIELIARLARYGASHEVDVCDPAREAWGLRYLQAANQGPLSAERLETIFRAIVEPAGPGDDHAAEPR